MVTKKGKGLADRESLTPDLFQAEGQGRGRVTGVWRAQKAFSLTPQ